MWVTCGIHVQVEPSNHRHRAPVCEVCGRALDLSVFVFAFIFLVPAEFMLIPVMLELGFSFVSPFWYRLV